MGEGRARMTWRMGWTGRVCGDVFEEDEEV